MDNKGSELLMEALEHYHQIIKQEELGSDADMESFNRIIDLQKLRIEELKVRVDEEDRAEKRRAEEEKTANDSELEQKKLQHDILKTGFAVIGAVGSGVIGIWEFCEMINFEQEGSFRSTIGRMICSMWSRKK